MKYEFTYNQEIGHQGQSLVPHFPGGYSGVTIGPGYDLSGRSPAEIVADLTRVGVEPDIAEALSAAAYKSGFEAQQWVARHGGMYITEEQQKALYEEVLVPEYERRMLVQISEIHPGHDLELAQLSPHQREILFDYTYNVGLGRFPTLVEAVLQNDWETVGQHYERYVGDEPLAFRNGKFYETFLSAEGIDHYSHLVEEPSEFQQIDGLLDDMADEGGNNQDPEHEIHTETNFDDLLDDTNW